MNAHYGLLEHLLGSLAVAVLIVDLWERQEARTGGWFVGAALLGLLPLLLSPVPAVSAFVAGKEGLVELLTEGVLLALVVLSVRSRQPWILVGATLLFLEEIDYGQWFFDLPTPEVLGALGSKSGNLNTHNLPFVEVLWRLGPLLAVVALALRARWPQSLRAWAATARLPRLHPWLAGAAPLLHVCAFVSVLLLGDNRVDEARELGDVLLVALAWRLGDDG